MSVQKRRYIVKNIPPSLEENDVKTFFKRLGKISDVSIGSNAHGKFSFISVEGLPDKIDKSVEKYKGKVWNGNEITLELAKKESFMARLKREQAENAKAVKLVDKSEASSAANIVSALGPTSAKQNHNSKSNKKARKSSDCEDEISAASAEKTDLNTKTSNVLKNERKTSENVKRFSGTLDLYNNDLKKLPNKDSGNIEVMSAFEQFDSMWGDDEVSENKSLLKSFIGKQKSVKDTKEEKKSTNKLDKEKSKDLNRTPITKAEKKLRDDERRRKSLVERAAVVKSQKNIVRSSLSSTVSPVNKKIVFDAEELDIDKPVKKALFDDGEEEEETVFDVPLRTGDDLETKEKLMQLQSNFTGDDRFKLDKRFLNDGDEAYGQEKASKEVQEMVRYDPAKEGSTNTSKQEVKQAPLRVAPLVSKETFYEVSDNMKSALSEKTPSFSLLAAYGGKSKADPDTKVYNHEVSSKAIIKRNPLLDDSSDEEFDQTDVQEVAEIEETKKWKPVVCLPSGPRDNFFFADDDPLFKEAFEFMNKKNSEEAKEAALHYDDTRGELRKIVKDQLLKRTKRAALFRNKVGGMKKIRTTQFKKKYPTGKGRNHMRR